MKTIVIAIMLMFGSTTAMAMSINQHIQPQQPPMPNIQLPPPQQPPMPGVQLPPQFNPQQQKDLLDQAAASLIVADIRYRLNMIHHRINGHNMDSVRTYANAIRNNLTNQLTWFFPFGSYERDRLDWISTHMGRVSDLTWWNAFKENSDKMRARTVSAQLDLERLQQKINDTVGGVGYL